MSFDVPPDMPAGRYHVRWFAGGETGEAVVDHPGPAPCVPPYSPADLSWWLSDLERTMKMPVGFGERDVTEGEVRAAQMAFLQGALSQEQRQLVDACLSLVARSIPRVKAEETTAPAKRDWHQVVWDMQRDARYVLVTPWEWDGLPPKPGSVFPERDDDPSLGAARWMAK